MQKKFKYTVGEFLCRGVATRADLFFGHALDIKTFDVQGNPRDSISFACHPEFDGFDEVQSYSTEELLALAIEILSSGELEESLGEIRPHGLTLYLRFNGRGQERPNLATH